MRTAEIRTDAGAVVCSRCELARGALTRMRGLLGRRGLEPGTGMLIDPAPSVMTFFMRFTIDVVFLDRSQTVVKVVDSLRPWRVAGARKAVAALELPAGTAGRLGLAPGQQLVVDEATRSAG